MWRAQISGRIISMWYWLVHLHPLGRTLITWNPCGFHTTGSIAFGLLIIGRAFLGGSSSSGGHICSCWLEKQNQDSSKVTTYFQLWCWSECSKSKRLLDVMARVCFWATKDTFTMLDVVPHSVNQMAPDCCHRNQCPLRKLLKWRKRLFIEGLQNSTVDWSQLPISGSSSADSVEWGKLRFRKYRVIVEYLTVPRPRTLLISTWISRAPICVMAR
jgi:hypothetical protein